MGKGRDYTGQIINGVKILRMAESNHGAGHHIKWIYECKECGKECITGSNHIKDGEFGLCTFCMKKKTNQERSDIKSNRTKLQKIERDDCSDLIGDQYGCFKIIDVDKWKRSDRKDSWIPVCVCECQTCHSQIRKLKSQLKDLPKKCECHASKGEKKVSKYLSEHNIKFIDQKTFSDLSNNQHGRFEKRYDFYLLDYNCLIEYDGLQHFEPVNAWGGEAGLKDRQIRDEEKNIFAATHNIKLIRIRYDEDIEQRLNEEIVRLQKK